MCEACYKHIKSSTENDSVEPKSDFKDKSSAEIRKCEELYCRP